VTLNFQRTSQKPAPIIQQKQVAKNLRAATKGAAISVSPPSGAE